MVINILENGTLVQFYDTVTEALVDDKMKTYVIIIYIPVYETIINWIQDSPSLEKEKIKQNQALATLHTTENGPHSKLVLNMFRSSNVAPPCWSRI